MIAALLLGFVGSPQPSPGYTVHIEKNRYIGKAVVVCSVLAPGMVVGGGDNCDFHSRPDPVYCSFFLYDKGCVLSSHLPNHCGTSFGCQNLEAFDFPGARNKEETGL